VLRTFPQIHYICFHNQNSHKMEEKRSIWNETLNYGIILGLVSVGFSVLTYMFDLTFKSWIMVPSLVISLGVLYFLLRAYRDHYNNGYITYGKSVGAGVIINLYAGIIAAIYIYVLYKFIDPGLVEKSLAFAQEKMIAKGVPEEALDAAASMQAKMMKPWIQAVTSVFYSVFFGLLISLIVSLFIMKKGNPLLDEDVEEPKQ